MGWLSGWNYQEKHTITGPIAGAQTNYQLRFQIEYGPGISAGAVVYCFNQCKADFGDIRFTKADGETLLDYWIQHKTNSDVAYIWVEVDTIPASPSTIDIYIYYGNSGATTTENFANTWIETNDFSSDPNLNRDEASTGWGILVTWDVDDRDLANHRFDWDQYIYDHDWDAYGCGPRTGMYWEWEGENYGIVNGVYYMDDTDFVEGDWYLNWYESAAVNTSDTTVAWVEDEWYSYHTKFDGTYKLDIWRESTETYALQNHGNEDYDPQTVLYMGVGWYGGTGHPGTVTYDGVNDWIQSNPSRTPGWVYSYIDNFRVGNYCDPEPANTSWGGPETFRDLHCQFEVGQDSEDLLAQFFAKQWAEDLPAEFIVRSASTIDLYCQFDIEISSMDLLGIFNVRQETSIELLGAFSVRQEIPANLLGAFSVRHIGISVDLLGEFNIRHATSMDLFSSFNIRQETSIDLLGEFNIRQIASTDLLGKFYIGQSGSADLLGSFSIQNAATEELPGIFDIRQKASVDLIAFFDAQTSEDLFCVFSIRNTNTEDLSAEIIIRHIATRDLAAEFIISHSATLEIAAEFVIRHANVVSLFGEFVIRHPALADLLGEFITRRSAIRDLPAQFGVGQGSEDLPGKFVIRKTAILNLGGIFIVRHTGTTGLAVELVVQHMAMSDLRALFWVNYYTADLLAGFNIRQTSSRATDFMIIDNTRGLTIEDASRKMTVTPRRRMRVR